MWLSDIIEKTKPIAVYGNQDIHVTNITNNSKKVKPGGLFICISGFNQNGHFFGEEAVRNGAIAVITEHPLPLPITQIVVNNSRTSQALISNSFFNYPTSKLKLVGVTGTNGKTTTSYLIEAILKRAGLSTGLLSTINYRFGDTDIPAKHTTPDSLELGNIFNNMVDNHGEAAVMEVSSHALELERVTGCDFFATVFSNITRDHFDFHSNFDNYLLAKAKLFANQCSWSGKSPSSHHAIFNQDDPQSHYLINIAQAENIRTYGVKSLAQVQATEYSLKPNSSSFQVKIGKKLFDFRLQMPGLFNIYNGLAAITTGLIFGIDLPIIQEALEQFPGVPGRCQYINCGQDFQIMVDFAHNPHGLYSLLATIPYPNSTNKKIVVFGCEGGKDIGKRSPMGSIAAKYADYCIITTDNVYKEKPLRIAKDIEAGVILGGMKPSQYKIILDRYEAIKHALNLANPGDTVIIAGKGHETIQVINNQAIPFDDRVIVRQLLEGSSGNADKDLAITALYN